jgi:hypothetical protein
VELAFDLLLDAGEDVAVDVVDEVEGGEEDEGGGGSGDGGGAVGFGRGGRLDVPLRGRIAGVFWADFFSVVRGAVLLGDMRIWWWFVVVNLW